jgi:hypothetical protein
VSVLLWLTVPVLTPVAAMAAALALQRFEQIVLAPNQPLLEVQHED